jgi:hypothetical protein
VKNIQPDIYADVTLYPIEQGGRLSPLIGEWFGCPCKIQKDDVNAWDCRFILNGDPMQAGETRRLGVWCLSREKAIELFKTAGRFYLWELRIIGEAAVIPD